MTVVATAASTAFRVLDRSRQLQTALVLTGEVHDRLDDLVGRLPRSGNKLVVAALAAGMPQDLDEACSLMAAHHGTRRAGGSRAREKNVRLPAQLRARLFELADAARRREPLASRSLLASAILESTLPHNPAAAAALLEDYETALAWAQFRP